MTSVQEERDALHETYAGEGMAREVLSRILPDLQGGSVVGVVDGDGGGAEDLRLSGQGMKIPSAIYLQWWGDDGPDGYDAEPDDMDVSWCREKMFTHDIRYVRDKRQLAVRRYTIAELMEMLDKRCEPCAGCADIREFLACLP